MATLTSSPAFIIESASVIAPEASRKVSCSMRSSYMGPKLCVSQPAHQEHSRLTRVACTASLAEDATAVKIDPTVQEELKRAAAKKAASLVKPGSIVGIGTGSTACMAIEELGKLKVKDVSAVVTSFQARIFARQFGVRTVDLNDVNHIDLAIDGADEVDASMNLIKGGGAAHTLEKVVDTMAKETVIIVDQSKVVAKLGTTFPVPIEVLPPAISPVLRDLLALGGAPEIRSALRKDGPVMTDLGHMIVDVRFPDGIDDVAAMEKAINNIPGVVENGLFVGVVQKVLVACQDGDKSTVVELAEFVKSMAPASPPAP
eukprot:TRINITY_DN5199_c0_g1_i1.p1 TRINITY_DN5199_c0_g1~~TRINITY_DN5199_c0_g1_i1.p1  ORF type:complete len:347 (+),score=67.38 TRINITY_DN5199_c0_g1_i1:95-1042(+)